MSVAALSAAFKAFSKGADVAKTAEDLPLHEGLVVSHGINPENIVAAAKSGDLRLANPSLGVHKTTNPNMDFGSFLLLGKPKVLDKPGSATYSSDVYSARKPYISQQDTIHPKVQADLDAIRTEMDQLRKTALAKQDEPGYGSSQEYADLTARQEELWKQENLLMKSPKDSKYVFTDVDGVRREATPENLLTYINSFGDRLTEESFTTPDNAVTVLAAVADKAESAEAVQAWRSLLHGDAATVAKKMARDRRDWSTAAAELGQLHGIERAGDMNEAVGQLMVDVIQRMKDAGQVAEEAIQDLVRMGEIDGSALEILNSEAIPRLANSLGSGVTNYAEVRPRNILEVKQGGDLDTVIISKQDLEADLSGPAAVKELEKRGVEVHVIDAPWATDEYRRAFYQKMAELKKKGYVFGAGGATVAASFLAPSGDVYAAEGEAVQPAAGPAEPAVVASEGQQAVQVGQQGQEAASKPVGGSAEGQYGADLLSLAASLAVQARDFNANRQSAGFRGSNIRMPAGVSSLRAVFQPGRTQEVSNVTPEGYNQLAIDEGERLSAYKDTKGISTIGVGFNLEEPANRELFRSVTGFSVAEAIAGRKITKAQSRELLAITVERARADTQRLLPQLDTYPPKVQDALTNFVFNVGLSTASQFKNTLAAVRRRDGKAAAEGIRNSAYYKQVGARGERVAQAIEQLK